MCRSIAAASALLSASSLNAQAAAPPTDFNYAVPLAGNWTYAALSGGSEATFRNASALPQLVIRCTRATRRVSLSKPATAAAPSFSVWTSSASRSLPTGWDPATARLTAQLAAYDPLLDALAFSRGRIAVTVGAGPPLVLPAWPEIARVVEDCRS
jgi:hypothetical protein